MFLWLTKDKCHEAGKALGCSVRRRQSFAPETMSGSYAEKLLSDDHQQNSRAWHRAKCQLWLARRF